MSTSINSLSSTHHARLRRPAPDRADWYVAIAGVVATVIAATIYRAALHNGLASDFPADVEFTARGLTKGVVPGNFLLEVFTAMFGLFRTDTPALDIGLFIVLGLATGAKVWVSARFIISENATKSTPARGVMLGSIILVAGLLSLTFCLPAEHVYLGGIPPNVWHNPSTILLMPFAIGLFWSSLLFLREPQSKWLWISLALGALNVAAKPSFILCFLPVFPCAAALRFGFGRKLVGALLVVAGITCMLGAQYIYVYVVNPPGSTLTSSTGVIVAPLEVWRLYTSEIGRSILASYCFPLVTLALGGGTVWRNRGVQYALALALVGLAEYALLAEGGARELEGNLTWQAIVTQYILFLALIAALVPWLRHKRWGLRQTLIALAFAAHVWAGIHFLSHWFATKAYV